MESILADKNILVVDDNKSSCNFIKNILTNLVKNVDRAESGEEALRKVRDNKYDLIFMDINIPDMNGYEISKNIRLGNGLEGVKKIHYSNIPIVTFTSVSKDLAKQFSLESGMNDFVQKPATQELVIDTLSKWLLSITNGKKTILLAEDDLTSAKLVSFMLKASGYNVIHAKNGQRALDILKEEVENIDLILMDTQMPILDGIEATRIIRDMKYRNYKNIPIIATSGNKDDLSSKNAIDSGMNYYLGKPFQKDNLIEIIENHLMN